MAKLKTRKGSEDHAVVSREKWLEARIKFLAREKEFTRERDRLNEERRRLPWVKVEKNYVFETAKGKETLSDLFDGKSQLIVYHFMLGPGWEEGCPACSFWGDSYSGTETHLAQRDTAFVAASRAPLKEIDGFRKRMGWSFRWVSSSPSDFNYDFQASFTEKQIESGKVFYNFRMAEVDSTEREGISTFYKDETGAIYHTYSAYERGIDLLNTAYNLLDLTAKGRDENPENAMDWLDYHDKY